MDDFDFSKEPGKKIINFKKYIKKEPIISVIIPSYNSNTEYLEQTITSVLNQTFPYYEILIIDDGSTNEKSLEKLSELEKIDDRIKLFHKKNEGLATTRDYGAKMSSKTSKYLMFIDDDDLIEPTYLECAYWSLETNKDAAWSYSDSLGFGTMNYVWNKYFDSEKMKKQNDLLSAALVRKNDFFAVNGYDLKDKAVNEDWNFWLKLIAKEKYPVHMSYYGQWYRRKNTGELKKSIENKKRSIEIINNTSKDIKKEIKAIQYPKYKYNYDYIPEEVSDIVVPQIQEYEEKINLLFIIPWMITGGADIFNLNLVKGLNKNRYSITIITTEPNRNVLRQKFEENENVIIYDLTSFLNQEYWLAFINYIIQKENINLILNSNSKFGYSILPYIKAEYPQIPIIDYVHMEEWYNRNGGYSRYSAMYKSVIDKTLVCNDNSRKILVNYFGKEETEVETVYIGVNEEKFNPLKFDKEEIYKKYIKKANKKIILYICRISEQKRPLLFLEIIAKLKEKRQDFKVLVVGEGNLLNEMKDKAKKLKIYDDIIFTGNITNTAEVYRISDVSINCSIKEGLALTSYESLSMGVPVVSSDVGGQKELITNDVGKIIPMLQNEKDYYLENYYSKEITDFVNAIDEILNNKNKYMAKCRERIINNFSEKNMIDKISSIFENAINAPKKEKIENGKGLALNKNILKELMGINIMNDETEYRWECTEYERKAYGKAYSIDGINYKHELIKEKLWKIPMWRAFIKLIHKIKK